MDLVELTDLVVGLPDGGQAGGLCGHNINADTEISTQGCHAGTYELHDFIFHITVFEYGTDDRQCHILRSYALDWLALQINGYHLRHIDIVGLVQQLLYQLRSALAHRHRAERTVACMGI